MATASPGHSPGPRLRQSSLWRRPLLVGVCFGLGYGLMQRLLDLRLPGFVQWGQSFEVRDVPGTSLDSLRLRFGSEGQDLRGRLDLLELQPATPQPAEQADQLAAPGFEAAEPGQEVASPAAQVPAADTRLPGAAPPPPSLPPPPTPRQP